MGNFSVRVRLTRWGSLWGSDIAGTQGSAASVPEKTDSPSFRPQTRLCLGPRDIMRFVFSQLDVVLLKRKAQVVGGKLGGHEPAVFLRERE